MLSIQKGFLASSLLIASIGASAQNLDVNNTGWYVGGAIGRSSTNAESSVFSNHKHTENVAAYGGYNFTEWFGLETTLFGTGDVSDANTDINNAYYAGLSIAPKITLHINPSIAIFAKAGLAYLSYTEEYDRYTSDSSYGYYYYDNYNKSRTWDKTVGTYSLGMEFSATQHVKVRLVYDYMSGNLKDTGYDYKNDRHYRTTYENIDAKLNQVSLGVHYQF